MMNAKPIYETETKEYKIVITRQIFDTHRPITNKNCLARYYSNEFDDPDVATTSNSPPVNMYKWTHPVYSIRIEFYNNIPRLRSTAIIGIKYNGAFFSIMNRIRDVGFVKYSYNQEGSKKLSKFLIKKRILNTSKLFRLKGIINRLEYEQGGDGLFYFLSGDVKVFLKVCPKYELRKIMSVIRHDYYKIMEKRN